MQAIYFYFDDSGILHSTNLSKKFVYAGYFFTSKEKSDDAKRKYKKLVKQIQWALDTKEELKASKISNKYKQKLYTVLKNENSVSLTVNINRVHNYILASSKSICRYKDYILKIAIKKVIKHLIDEQIIMHDEDIEIHVYVDEQLTATDGIYGLETSIKEELQYGISNYNYGSFYPPLFSGEVSVEVKYCESKCNYMIQAADILANRIFASYRDNRPELRRIPNHVLLTFP